MGQGKKASAPPELNYMDHLAVKFQQSETTCSFMMLWNTSIFDFSSPFQYFQSYTLLFQFSAQNIVGAKQHLEIEGKIDALLKAPHIQINMMKWQKTLHLAEELTQTHSNLDSIIF